MNVDFGGVTPPNEDAFLVYIIVEGVPHHCSLLLVPAIIRQTDPVHTSSTEPTYNEGPKSYFFGYHSVGQAKESAIRIEALVGGYSPDDVLYVGFANSNYW